MMKGLPFSEVIGGDLCSGCGLCTAMVGTARGRMVMTGDGYLRPEIPDGLSGAEEVVFAEICPGSRVHLPQGNQMLDARPEWGPLLAVRTGHATDPELRHHASSGGALSALLNILLESGEAGFVLHIGANVEVPWLNQEAISHDSAGVLAASGSRYAPSAPLAGVLARLEDGIPFIVVGKPCDIAALRAYARHDARVDRLVVAMIAFMCGGIPSEAGIRKLIGKMGATPEEVTAFRFRGDGWPGKATANTADGGRHAISYARSWGEVLSKHVQLRCKICADGIGMSADVVCADAWYGGDDGYPRFEEEAGRSLVLARTARGLALVDKAEGAGKMVTEPLAPGEIEKMQPYQLRRTRLTLSRLMGMRLAGRAVPAFTGRSLLGFAWSAGLVANIRSFAGALLRAARGRL